MTCIYLHEKVLTLEGNIFNYITQYSWGIKGFNTPQGVWSKTTLITSSVGGAGVDPLPRKMDTFFLRYMAHSVTIYRNFQTNAMESTVEVSNVDWKFL